MMISLPPKLLILIWFLQKVEPEAGVIMLIIDALPAQGNDTVGKWQWGKESSKAMKCRALVLDSLLDQLQKDLKHPQSVCSSDVQFFARIIKKSHNSKYRPERDREIYLHQPGTLRVSLPIGQGFCRVDVPSLLCRLVGLCRSPLVWHCLESLNDSAKRRSPCGTWGQLRPHISECDSSLLWEVDKDTRKVTSGIQRSVNSWKIVL